MVQITSYRTFTSSLCLSVLAAALITTVLPAQTKPLLTPQDYGQFEMAGRTIISDNGKWIAYAIQRVNDTTEIRLGSLERDSTRVFRWGSAANFSTNSRWMSWSINPTPEEREKAQRDKKPVELRLGLLNLADGSERTFDGVRAHSFDPKGEFLALHGYAPSEPRNKGADLRILNLRTGSETVLGNVSTFAWNNKTSLLAMIVSTGTAAGNGVQVYTPSTGQIRTLDGGDASYRSLAWRDSVADLAVLKSAGKAAQSGGRQIVLAWRGLNAANPAQFQLDSVAAGLADSLIIAEHYAPRWSEDGTRIAIGLQPAPVKEDSTEKKISNDSLPGVQLWHSNDLLIVPQQKAQAAARERRTLLAVWQLQNNRVTQLASSLDANTLMVNGWRHAWERDDSRYPWGAKFGRRYHDVSVIDAATGSRRTVIDSVRFSYASGAGRYIVTFDGRDYWSHELANGKKINITSGVNAVFTNTTTDTPTDLLPPVGIGGWLDNDAAVLLYDQYDIWRVSLDGSGARRITNGAPERIIHRVYSTFGPTRPTISPSASLYLSLQGEITQKRGYARVRLSGGNVERLLFEDRYSQTLVKADSAPVYLYRSEARDVSPNYFVASADLKNGRQVTNTNPFLNDYAWTRSELIDYKNETGRDLQGVLLYPANYDPSRAYPMIVYAYEKLTSQMHFFQAPNERVYYNFTAWTQNGYFVLLPDIHFRARDPGVSLLETLRPAVGGVVERGLVDKDRVGFVGHSWGGYHATYVATHSTLFAASVAGAPLTDFVSFMGQIHWNPGTPEVDHWETGQARMEVPYWEDVDAHHRNSPIHNVHNMSTPLLMAFGDSDGVVDWDQGTEFYNFARRAGKQMVLVVYEGEDHGFTRKPNQIDYHRRILEWFGHYLKSEPAPKWITDGIPLNEVDKERRRVAR